jgi:hypothetical protein
VYATGPAERRSLGLALLLADKAVLLEPGNAAYKNTLGVVCRPFTVAGSGYKMAPANKLDNLAPWRRP